MSDIKPDDWVLFRGSSYDKVSVDLRQVEKATAQLVKFKGGYPRQCNRLSVVATFENEEAAKRVRDAIGGVAGEFNRRRRAAEDERSRRVTEALTSANAAIAEIVAREKAGKQ